MDKKFCIKFIGYWTLNALVLSLADSLFPDMFELGNEYITTPSAAIFSGFFLTVLLFMAKGLAKTFNLNKKGRYAMFLYYWLAAGAGVWLTARAADVSGFGVSRFTWALACGFAISFSNWLARQAFKGIN